MCLIIGEQIAGCVQKVFKFWTSSSLHWTKLIKKKLPPQKKKKSVVLHWTKLLHHNLEVNFSLSLSLSWIWDYVFFMFFIIANLQPYSHKQQQKNLKKKKKIQQTQNSQFQSPNTFHTRKQYLTRFVILKTISTSNANQNPLSAIRITTILT